MNNTPAHTSQALRFRRCTRKGYGAFRSIGRCVTIGHLSKSEVNASLNKQKPGVLLVRKQEVQQRESHEEDVPILLLLQEMLAFLLPVTANDVCCCPSVAINSAINNYKPYEYMSTYTAFCIPRHKRKR